MSESYHREDNVGLPYRGSGFYSNFDSPNTTTSGPLSAVIGSSYSRLNTADGVKLPNWRDIIRSGGNATTSFTGRRIIAQANGYQAFQDLAWRNPNNPADMHTRYCYASGVFFYTGAPTVSDPPPSQTVTDVTNRCIRSFLSRCDSAISSFEAGQDFGEYKETLNSLVNPLSSLRRHVSGYFDTLKKVRRKTRGSVGLRKALTDTYLEWTFGWNPLVSDVAKAYVNLRSIRFENIPVESSATGQYDGSNTAWNPPLPPGTPFTVEGNIRTTSEYTCRYKGMIRNELDPSGRVSLAQDLQVLPENWLPTAWDLLPYSFIADYFTNIGDIIRGYSFVFGRLSWACKTTRNSKFAVYTVKRVTPFDLAPPNVFIRNRAICRGGNASMVDRKVTRAKLTSDDLIPRFAFSIPHGVKPWLNMAALMLSRSVPLVPFFR